MKQNSAVQRVRRALVTMLLAATTALALTGCGPVNAGSAAATAFEAEFSDAADVASVEASGSNDLPFVGSVRATVTADAGLSDARVDDLAARVGEYLDAHSGISWRVALEADGLRVGISEDAADTGLNLTVARDLLATEHISHATVGVSLDDQVVQVSVDGPAALHAGYTAAAAAVDRLDVSEGRSNAVAIADGPFSVDDASWRGEDTDVETVLDVFDALLERFPLVEGVLEPGEMSVRAASEDDVDAIRAYLATLPAASGLDVRVQGGITFRSADATPLADAVGKAMRGIPGVSRISIGEDVVMVTVDSFATGRTVLTAATLIPEFGRLSRFGLFTADPYGADNSFVDRVFAAPAEVSGALSLAEAVSSVPGFDRVEVADGKLSLRLDDASEAAVTAFVAAVKPTLVAGGWRVWINADGHVESFDAAPTIALDDDKYTKRDKADQAFADMLVRVWDAG